jgi:alpha-glucosidase (family GH31 glycosyl hydrolase)
MDNPMALYGHVPIMVGHSAAHTTGFFWLNAAETWIDIDKSVPGKVSTHWISESGIILASRTFTKGLLSCCDLVRFFFFVLVFFFFVGCDGTVC